MPDVLTAEVQCIPDVLTARGAYLISDKEVSYVVIYVFLLYSAVWKPKMVQLKSLIVADEESLPPIGAS
jgi:hypothetical protein